MVAGKIVNKLGMREEFPRTVEKKQSSTLGRALFGQQDYYPNKDTLCEESICVDRMSINDCERRSSVEEERDEPTNCDRNEVTSAEERIYTGRRVIDDCKRIDPEELQRDETMNIGQTFVVLQTNDRGTSELPKCRLYQESEQTKGKLRRKAIYTADGPSKRRKNQGTTHDSESKSSRITALYELGKNKVILNRELAATEPKDDRVIVNIEAAKNSRITTLYELGKNRVMVNRELAAIKPKINTVVVNIKSARPSERIIGLYELGKHRVMINREMAATKLRTTDNRAAHVAALSDAKAGASEIAGRRLYTQAKRSAERKNKLRQIARSIALPQIKLATQQRNNEKSIDWGTSPIERFLALHKEGTNRVAADRELETGVSENKTNLSNEQINAGYASMRQMELYEMGKKRLIDERLNQKQHSDTILDIDPPSKLGTAIVANATMIKLYEMSKEMRENGKKRCEEIVSGKEGMYTDIQLTPRPSKDIAPNATMIKLYAMSKLMREHGRERREEIVHAKVDFPVIKV